MPDARVIPLSPDGPAAPPSAVSSPAGSVDGGRSLAPAREPLRSVPDIPADTPEESTADGGDGNRGTGGDPYPGQTTPPLGTRGAALGFLRRRLAGDYPVDEFGFDAELTKSVLMAPMRPLYERYFRVETRGMEHVPDTGAALLVANHSGALPLDAIMTQVALLDHHPASRHLRMLGADLLFRLPIIATIARKGGVTLACNPDAERLLTEGHLVGVWPEGFKGIGKPYSERYRLQRFGRGGFVAAAVRTGAPIIPCSIIGAEEIYPVLGNASWLARLLSLPYIPITPTFPWLGALGLVPLPSKWIIEFGEPIETSGYGGAAADDPMLIFNITDEVRETIQSTLYKLLMQRRSVFF
jgi:1-acyl-sn-glycerol-3-phosphate acyltransferase